MHQAGTGAGETRFFAGFGGHAVQLVDREAQIRLFAAGRLQIGKGLGVGLGRRLPGRVEGGHLGGRAGLPGEGVEDGQVVGGVEQAMLVELALHLDQTITDSGQETDAGRLIIDESAAAAIGAQGPAQDERAVPVEASFGDQGAGRMIVGDIEHGGDTGLFGFAPDQPCFGPLAQGEAKGIQQDRFAGAGFAGQHR